MNNNMLCQILVHSGALDGVDVRLPGGAGGGGAAARGRARPHAPAARRVPAPAHAPLLPVRSLISTIKCSDH